MNTISVGVGLFLQVWYDKSDRIWYGRYVDAAGNQIGSAWYDSTRDYVLIFRPEPAVMSAT